MKIEYGIPVPRGVQKDWTAWNALSGSEKGLLNYNVPAEWGAPVACAAWEDRFRHTRLIVAHYPNGRSATVRIDANGNWKTLFGEVG